MKIRIIGGGIAGLAAAIRLNQHRSEATVYEKSSLAGGSGMGFILLNNGIQALAELGLRDQMDSFATKLNCAQILRHDGRLLSETTLIECYGASREKFSRVLLTSTPPGRVRTKMVFSHFDVREVIGLEHEEYSEGASKVHFENGERVSGDLFIGADGVRSRMRRALFPEHQLAPVRIKELVSMIHNKDLYRWLERRFLKFVHESGGLALGIVPCARDEVVWFLQFDSHKWNLEFAGLAKESLRKRVKELVHNWPEPVAQLVDSTDFSRSHVWRTTDLSPLPSYHRGNTVLIGDAAHAQLTFTSQGVNSALEDAVLLGDLIGLTGSNFRYLPSVLSQFYNARYNAMKRYHCVGRELLTRFLGPPNDKDISIPLVQEDLGRM